MWSKEKETLDEFVDKLPTEALIHLLGGGQPNTGVANTFGMGNLPEYGIPNIMTADGPAGLRIQPQCGVNTTAWPCATLLACTWDPELIEEIGKAGGEEVKENNIGIWLTPGCQHSQKPALRKKLRVLFRGSACGRKIRCGNGTRYAVRAYRGKCETLLLQQQRNKPKRQRFPRFRACAA